ncbi:hypothetical protein CEX98_13100 [Pseudoalteromonas piscicida]|uniref:Uncharacterized protein n=1 Tax=Pseudoalteromonas piscicida TaxID=43662 RepID=A0A2A5JP96_PSEO7|nr:hypothetical protein CEX98_13100 [Pseudoalteromonas piscicida]
MPIKRCPSGSPECGLFIVAQLLLRLLGGKSSAATKAYSGKQKSNSKGQQDLNGLGVFLVMPWPYLSILNK